MLSKIPNTEPADCGAWSTVVPAGCYRFGAFEVDFQAWELRKSGLRVRIQDQPLQALSILLERPGKIVTRDDFRKLLWSEDTFVDFDHGLNATIKKLRQGLEDDPHSPRFIETLPRHGYRFIAAVSQTTPKSWHQLHAWGRDLRRREIERDAWRSGVAWLGRCRDGLQRLRNRCLAIFFML